MSRIGKQPITVPKGVECQISQQNFKAKGPKGEMAHVIHNLVKVSQQDNVITVSVNEESKDAWALAGTTRALLSNIVNGVDQGFEKKLTLIGVGYRAEAKGKKIVLNVGYSHPVEMDVPEGLTVTTPSQTEIIVAGANKQLVGQLAANIRKVRPPEPYKGKGIRYADEYVEKKETKK